MADPAKLEHEAESENTEGHYQSFAAQDHSIHGDVQAAQDRLTEAGRHYDQSGRSYSEAAREHLKAVGGSETEREAWARDRAAADYGFAASVFWYAGRSYADGYDFQHAAESMEAAAGAYIAEARLREERGQTQQASTLRVEATFRYLDAQRYYQQAADFRRSLAGNLAAVGERQAAAEERSQAEELDARAIAAGESVNEEGPNYHAAYEASYTGVNKSAYK